jgi:TolB protein
MAKTDHWGPLAAAAGTLVAVGLLMLIMVVEVRPAEATFPGKNGKIAFVRDRGPLGAHIYTINPDGSGLAKISTRPSFASSPAWSPDGKKIVFSRDDLYVMKSDGTKVKRLTNNPKAGQMVLAAPDWQPVP